MKINIWFSLSILSLSIATQAALCTGQKLDQIILKFKNNPSKLQLSAADQRDFSIKFAALSDLPIKKVDSLASGAFFLTLDTAQMELRANKLHANKEHYFLDRLAQLATLPTVKYAERNIELCPITPPKFVSDYSHKYQKINIVINHALQWDQFSYPGIYLESSSGAGDGAWSISRGFANPPIVVANLESYNTNPDLEPNIVPGWNFLNPAKKTDVSEPGDDHGTQVAGIMAASGLTAEGITGVGPLLKLLPVEIGSLDQFVDATFWAAGKPVKNTPLNTNPAKVVNMSFEYTAPVPCPGPLQEAINEFAKTGVLVTAAGNNNAPLSRNPPVLCDNVIIVSATERNGFRASYSDYGARVTLAAPGGEGGPGGNCNVNGILATVSIGKGCQGSDYGFNVGTSFASPEVAGIAGLIFAAGVNDPYLTPRKVRDILLASVEPFGTTPNPELSCTGVKACGIGIVNAYNALRLETDGSKYLIAAPSPTDMRIEPSLGAYTICQSGKLIPTHDDIASPIPGIDWQEEKNTRRCLPLATYQTPALSISGVTLIAKYGALTYHLTVPNNLTCIVKNAHAFECQ